MATTRVTVAAVVVRMTLLWTAAAGLAGWISPITAQAVNDEQCSPPFFDLWERNSLLFNASKMPSWPNSSSPPVSSQINCEGRHCFQFPVRALYCLRPSDARTALDFRCSCQKHSLRLVNERVHCAFKNEDELPSCVFSNSCYLTFSLTPVNSNRLTAARLAVILAMLVGILGCCIAVVSISHRHCKDNIIEGVAINDSRPGSCSPSPLIINVDGTLASETVLPAVVLTDVAHLVAQAEIISSTLGTKPT